MHFLIRCCRSPVILKTGTMMSLYYRNIEILFNYQEEAKWFTNLKEPALAKSPST